MPLEIVITEWALQSYLDLVGSDQVTRKEYMTVLRPDILRLKQYPLDDSFKTSSFWGRATLRGGVPVEDGYKMKWHNIGNGKVQLRLCVAMIKGVAYLCQAYVKGNDATDKRNAATLLVRIDLIEQGRYERRGSL